MDNYDKLYYIMDYSFIINTIKTCITILFYYKIDTKILNNYLVFYPNNNKYLDRVKIYKELIIIQIRII